MPTFPEFVGGDGGNTPRPNKPGPFQIGTNRYVTALNTTTDTATYFTTNTNITTQVLIGTAIWWSLTDDSPGTSTDPSYPGDGYTHQTIIVNTDTVGATSTFQYVAPQMHGTDTGTGLFLATETIITTFITTDTNNFQVLEVSMYKSTDTGQTWAEKDAANSKEISPLYLQYSACKDMATGTAVHIIFVGTADTLAHAKYDANTDTWGATVTGPPAQTTHSGTNTFVTMSLDCIHQSTGNHIGITVQSTVSGGVPISSFISYDVSGGGFSSYVDLPGTSGITTYTPMGIVSGNGDLLTCIFESLPASDSTRRLWQQAISSAGVPGAQVEITAGRTTNSSVESFFLYPVDICWNSGDNKVTVVYFFEGDDDETMRYLSGSSADPITFTSSNFSAASGGDQIGDFAVAVNGAGTYVFWTVSDTVVTYYSTVDVGVTTNTIGTTTDAEVDMNAGGFTASWAITWDDFQSSAQYYWEPILVPFTGHRMMPQYIKRFNAPGN